MSETNEGISVRLASDHYRIEFSKTVTADGHSITRSAAITIPAEVLADPGNQCENALWLLRKHLGDSSDE
jgi:hypothetical protein